jgi:hypothetical protein
MTDHSSSDEPHDDLIQPFLLSEETWNGEGREETQSSEAFMGKCVCRCRRRLQQSCFLVGSLLGTVASVTDLCRHPKAPNDDTAILTDGPQDLLKFWDTYKILMCASTLLYLLDSVIHILQLYQAQRTEEEHVLIDNPAANAAARVQHDYRSAVAALDPLESSHESWYFSILFGIAALFDLLSSLTEDDDAPLPSFFLGAICVDLFLASAVVTMYSKRQLYLTLSLISNMNDNDEYRMWVLLCLGDLFFLLGCTIDVIVNLANNPWREANWTFIQIASLCSSLAWLSDAIVYQVVDADIFDVGIGIMPSYHVNGNNSDLQETSEQRC